MYNYAIDRYSIALFVAGAVLTGPANAQVFLCKDAAGKAMYSDSACGAHGKVVSNLNINTIEATRIEAPERSGKELLAAEVANNCPGSQEIRNMETSLTSNSFKGDEKRNEREFMQAEVRRARACSRKGGTYTPDDWKRIEQAQADQNDASEADRASARATAESIHASAASKQEVDWMQTDRLVRAQRNAEEEAASARRDAEEKTDRTRPPGPRFGGRPMQ